MNIACVLAVAVLPGLQPDGSVLLHNQRPIRPVGEQVELGNFPVNLAVDPSGRWAAVVHAGNRDHELRVVDLRAEKVVQTVPMAEAFYGLAFSADGRELACSGGADGVLHLYPFAKGRLGPAREIQLPASGRYAVVSGVALSPDGRNAFVSILFACTVLRVDLGSGAVAWTTTIEPAGVVTARPHEGEVILEDLRPLVQNSDPLALLVDAQRGRLYASLWGQSAVAVLDAGSGRLLARWPVGLHPNEMVLSRDGRLFVSDGGENAVTVVDVATGRPLEKLTTSWSPQDLPGSTPDSLALSPDGRRLFIANAYTNDIAVFEVGTPGAARVMGFIPSGWFPSSVRLTPDGRELLVVSARGLRALPNNRGETTQFNLIAGIYKGSLGILRMPKGDAFDTALSRWTAIAATCRPAPPKPAPETGNPVPDRRGGVTPIRNVIYIIKENRTYDQVLGDMAEGNGDPHLCLFGEKVTPNIHLMAREFVLLDNFYANAEVSPQGHEWSTAGYVSEFVEKTWPIEYDHHATRMPYTAEGRYGAAVPALGYLWDHAKAAGLSYRDYGEFVVGAATPDDPATADLPALLGHVDPYYRGWDLHYSDLNRAARFIAELRRFEREGAMPRLQIVRLPNDHTEGAKAGALRPRAMVAQNDLALGRIVEAVSHSRFWPQTAIFVVEDDAQNGPDHVDAHRTEALVISPYVRRGAVDSTPYTTCSMLATIEHILGLDPMSQFDAAAEPMARSFRAQADLRPFEAVPARIDLGERNAPKTKAAAASEALDFSREDANDDIAFNRIIWQAERGDLAVMPVPVHAAFVRPMPKETDDDD